MIPPVRVSVEADHSCNWRCCWGCKDQEKTTTPPNTPVIDVQSKDSGSEIITTTQEKTVTVVHRHLHTPRDQEMKE